MKKVLFVVEAFGGGIFTYISDLANMLSDEYKVYIAYSIRKETPDNFKDYFNDGISLIPVNNFTREINLKKDIGSLFEIRKIVREIDPDIIHLHSSKAGVLGRIAFSGRKCPVFYTPHGYSFFMPGVSRKKRAMYKFIEKICSLRKCVTIACSKSEYDASRELTSRTEYVNNGINIKNIDKILTTEPAVKRKGLTIATLGRIADQKNPKVFNQIATALPNDKFVWIGDGNMRDTLTADNITITGWLDRKSAIKEMVNSDVFLLTSRYEGLPMSLLEAMYMEKVCVVSSVVGNRDVINGKNGFLCKNLDDYVTAVNTIKHTDTEKIKKQAKTDVLEEYNTEIMAKKYKKIYRKYLK